ncbi:MAG TPA: ArsO family NAD(P)H-dependent flavin-containing monooxygenase [Chlorobiota bacterium]|nr:ArsO family NAD(P)H-dependent flavin-containing monooxygenase [Chlorobiota bacterium]
MSRQMMSTLAMFAVMERHSWIIVGAGQAGLAVAYTLRRAGIADVVLLDAEQGPGGAWRHTWPSLVLFSPREASTLPGMFFPPTKDLYPTRDEALSYLASYEQRYGFDIRRPVNVVSVAPINDGFRLETSEGAFEADHVVGCTGTWSEPVLPNIDGIDSYTGRILHSGHYGGPGDDQNESQRGFQNHRVIVVGGGNSGAQIFADLDAVAHVTWCVREPPTFLPDDVDGRVLFDAASLKRKAIESGSATTPTSTLGDIVMVPSLRALRDRGRLHHTMMFERFTATGVIWSDGTEEHVDDVIFATGFRPALRPFAPCLTITEDGRIPLRNSAVVNCPGLYLVGYGNWTGYASATLIGVGMAAKTIVSDLDTSRS